MLIAAFANDGGPLLAIDAAVASRWRGGGRDADEPIKAGSDYARACEADYPAGRVEFDGTWGAVIGAEEGIAQAGWRCSMRSAAYFLIGSVYGDERTDRQLVAMIESEAGPEWHALGLVRIDSGRLMLLHAASAGTEVVLNPQGRQAGIGDALTLALPLGEYEVSASEVKVDDNGLYSVVRWVPRHGSSKPAV